MFGAVLTLTLLSLVYGNAEKPNFIVIFADDMGYGDLQSYGHPTQEKGPIDVLADEGMRFTQWYSASSVCSPSRAALLTGRLPVRNGVYGDPRVFQTEDSGGLPKNEITIAEALKSQGYATGMVGKWHLGINEHVASDGNHLPSNHGFDFVGINLPFSFHYYCDPAQFDVHEMKNSCFLYKNATIVEQPINPATLTRRIVDDALEFIRESRTHPFFLYMPMPQPHTAMICSKEFCGKSKRGKYGDQINEMAWAVGSVVSELRQLNLDKNTLVLFLSDNGPNTALCFTGGSSGHLSGDKGSTWDGGLEVPAIAWWPGTIRGDTVSSEILSTMDIFPTLLKLAGATAPSGVILDGVPIDHILFGDDTKLTSKPPHEALFHYCSDRLMAVRMGRYKIVFFSHDLSKKENASANCPDGIPLQNKSYFRNCSDVVSHNPPLIFDLDSDPGEIFPLDPELYSSTLERANDLVSQHLESIVQVPSQMGNFNEALRPCCAPPTCLCN